MRGGGVVTPRLEHDLIEFALARGAHIPPSCLRDMPSSKVHRLFVILREVHKLEEEEIRKASKK